MELSKAGKKVRLSGRDVGLIPANSPLGKILGKPFDGRLVWWMMANVLTVDTPMGRKMQASIVQHGAPLGRVRREELTAAGVALTPRLSRIQSGQPCLEDGRTLAVDGVFWATGFEPNYRWISLPIFDAQGYPCHTRGVAQGAPGLYFLGLAFQTGLSSSLLGGVGRDAAYLAGQISQDGH